MLPNSHRHNTSNRIPIQYLRGSTQGQGDGDETGHAFIYTLPSQRSRQRGWPCLLPSLPDLPLHARCPAKYVGMGRKDANRIVRVRPSRFRHTAVTGRRAPQRRGRAQTSLAVLPLSQKALAGAGPVPASPRDAQRSRAAAAEGRLAALRESAGGAPGGRRPRRREERRAGAGPHLGASPPTSFRPSSRAPSAAPPVRMRG